MEPEPEPEPESGSAALSQNLIDDLLHIVRAATDGQAHAGQAFNDLYAMNVAHKQELRAFQESHPQLKPKSADLFNLTGGRLQFRRSDGGRFGKAAYIVEVAEPEPEPESGSDALSMASHRPCNQDKGGHEGGSLAQTANAPAVTAPSARKHGRGKAGTAGAHAKPEEAKEQVSLPNWAVGIIIGPQGSAIKALETESGAKVAIDRRDGTATVTGSREEMAKAVASIQETIKAKRQVPKPRAAGQRTGGAHAKPEEAKEQVSLPNWAVGIIIGPQGSAIKALETESGAKVAIDRRDGTATVTGSREEVAKAVASIQETIKAKRQVPKPRAAGQRTGGAQSKPEEAKEQVSLPNWAVGIIIGPQGSAIKALETESGAKVAIDRRDGTATVTGSREEVAKAVASIQETIKAKRQVPKPRAAGQRTGGAQSKPEEAKEQVSLPNWAVGIIIGPQGSAIKALETESGAKVAIDRRDGTATVTGSREEVAKAVASIQETIKAKRQVPKPRAAGQRTGGASIQKTIKVSGMAKSTVDQTDPPQQVDGTRDQEPAGSDGLGLPPRCDAPQPTGLKHMQGHLESETLVALVEPEPQDAPLGPESTLSQDPADGKLVASRSKGNIPVTRSLEDGELAKCDMTTDPHNPPTEFTHKEWIEVLDAIRDLGTRPGDASRHLHDASSAMNDIQDSYGNSVTLWAVKGRLFAECVVNFVLGSQTREESLFARIDRVKFKTASGTIDAQKTHDLISYLHDLRILGNTASHASTGRSQRHLTDVDKPRLVHTLYRAACLLHELGHLATNDADKQLELSEEDRALIELLESVDATDDEQVEEPSPVIFGSFSLPSDQSEASGWSEGTVAIVRRDHKYALIQPVESSQHPKRKIRKVHCKSGVAGFSWLKRGMRVRFITAPIDADSPRMAEVCALNFPDMLRLTAPFWEVDSGCGDRGEIQHLKVSVVHPDWKDTSRQRPCFLHLHKDGVGTGTFWKERGADTSCSLDAEGRFRREGNKLTLTWNSAEWGDEVFTWSSQHYEFIGQPDPHRHKPGDYALFMFELESCVLAQRFPILPLSERKFDFFIAHCQSGKAQAVALKQALEKMNVEREGRKVSVQLGPAAIVPADLVAESKQESRVLLNEPGRWDCMISYTQRNANAVVLAEALYSSLTAQGLNVWLDIKMKQLNEEAMKEAAENSSCIIAIVTGATISSKDADVTSLDGLDTSKMDDPMANAYFNRMWCMKELRWARAAGVPIQPVIRVEDQPKVGELIDQAPEDLKDLGSIDFLSLIRTSPAFWAASIRQLIDGMLSLQRRQASSGCKPEPEFEVDMTLDNIEESLHNSRNVITCISDHFMSLSVCNNQLRWAKMYGCNFIGATVDGMDLMTEKSRAPDDLAHLLESIQRPFLDLHEPATITRELLDSKGLLSRAGLVPGSEKIVGGDRARQAVVKFCRYRKFGKLRLEPHDPGNYDLGTRHKHDVFFFFEAGAPCFEQGDRVTCDLVPIAVGAFDGVHGVTPPSKDRAESEFCFAGFSATNVRLHMQAGSTSETLASAAPEPEPEHPEQHKSWTCQEVVAAQKSLESAGVDPFAKLTEPEPQPQPETESGSLNGWLSKLKLQQYEGVLVEEGYDELQFLCDADADDIDGLLEMLVKDKVMKKPHAKTFMKAWKKLSKAQ